MMDKQSAIVWVEQGKPCYYCYGYRFKGAVPKKITQAMAKELLPSYSFGKGFYELSFEDMDGEEILMFNEFSENDLY